MIFNIQFVIHSSYTCAINRELIDSQAMFHKRKLLKGSTLGQHARIQRASVDKRVNSTLFTTSSFVMSVCHKGPSIYTLFCTCVIGRPITARRLHGALIKIRRDLATRWPYSMEDHQREEKQRLRIRSSFPSTQVLYRVSRTLSPTRDFHGQL